MTLPSNAQIILNVELANLSQDVSYDLQPERRIELYQALGPSCIPGYREMWRQGDVKQLPNLTAADRVRTRIALQTAQKVIPLWESACRETDANFTQHEDLEMTEKEEQEYLQLRKVKHIEEISVYKVPRAYTPGHIIEMAELAFRGEVWNVEMFFHQSNEWWQIYPRPEQMEREFFIKWAAQEALYEAIGWVDYERNPPARDAVFAYAGVFEGETFESRKATVDKVKRNDFWRWWLSYAIPAAWPAERA